MYTYGIFPVVAIAGCSIAYLHALTSKQPFNDLKLLSLFGISPAIAIPLTKVLFDPANAYLSLRGLLILVACCFLLTVTLIKIIRIFKPGYGFPLTGKRLFDLNLKAATKACIGFFLAFVALLFFAINTTLLEPCRSIRCSGAEVLFGSNEQINAIVLMAAFLLNAFFSLAVFSALGLVIRFSRKTS